MKIILYITPNTSSVGDFAEQQKQKLNEIAYTSKPPFTYGLTFHDGHLKTDENGKYDDRKALDYYVVTIEDDQSATIEKKTL